MHLIYLSSLFIALSAGATVWQPPVGAKFQIILSGVPEISPSAQSVTPNADIFDVDLFDIDKQTIATLHKLNKKVICYFSAGTYEPNRNDSGSFLAADKGAKLKNWPNEQWVKTGSSSIRSIMANRIKLAKDKGCDAVDPDNMDGYGENGGGHTPKLTPADSIDFMKYLSATASQHGLSIGIKNSIEILDRVLNYTQFAVNEECVRTKECKQYEPFLNANKPVFHIEYPWGKLNILKTVTLLKRRSYCTDKSVSAQVASFSTVIKTMNLDGWAAFCDGTQATTRVKTVDTSKYAELGTGEGVTRRASEVEYR